MRARSMATLVLLCAAGCARDRARHENGTDLESGVRLIETGDEPRRVIRYRHTLGKSRSLDVITRGVSTGGIREQLGVRTAFIETDGDARYEITLHAVELVDPRQNQTPEAQRLRNQQGSFARVLVSRQGNVRETELPDTGPLKGLKSWVRYALIPFPTEAIGSGATWEVDGERGTARYRLAGSDYERAIVEFTVQPRGATLGAAASMAEGRVTVDLEAPPAERYEVTIRATAGDARPETTITATTR